jgi:serine/threonine protein phosphatase 1
MLSPSRACHHWVIGDVHGCADALERLVARLPAVDRLVLCGDVINRGPQIRRTMDLAWGLVSSGRAIWLMGNHEADLVAALRQGDWRAHRALAGCDTYRQLGDRHCRMWQERLEQLPRTYAGEGWLATHAGFNPDTWEPDLSIRMPFWQAYDGRFGEVVIGHTPGPQVRRLEQIVMVDTGACYGGELSAYCPETGAIRAVAGLQEPQPSTFTKQLAGCLS